MDPITLHQWQIKKNKKRVTLLEDIPNESYFNLIRELTGTVKGIKSNKHIPT